MSFKNYLTIVVLCITMSFLTMNPVNATNCKGGYRTDGTTAYCVVDSKQEKYYHCDAAKCGHDNARFVSWSKCVPFYKSDGTAKTTQNCVTYDRHDSSRYTCTNAKEDIFICPHKFEDRPIMSCDLSV
ncbi:uncharacterized protein MELLADRAFT_123273 [Melampsora larici-populina 98AG31]|uniref:Secreted protein n=1 Tax=Melampsora larici-populina (strain 98AG31 / pathotype 3-4-7) TaxID=747676 RepID=F4SC68_MELLP|nr:uncharacterized protein MELLADRAFT_123273 [Melampsora larici-populina 98AG31]EGF97752.1 secreted protein [Melampsora larici-populina 98AG31]